MMVTTRPKTLKDLMEGDNWTSALVILAKSQEEIVITASLQTRRYIALDKEGFRLTIGPTKRYLSTHTEVLEEITSCEKSTGNPGFTDESLVENLMIVLEAMK
jgi:hypothetical protein